MAMAAAWPSTLGPAKLTFWAPSLFRPTPLITA